MYRGDDEFAGCYLSEAIDELLRSDDWLGDSKLEGDVLLGDRGFSRVHLFNSFDVILTKSATEKLKKRGGYEREGIHCDPTIAGPRTVVERFFGRFKKMWKKLGKVSASPDTLDICFWEDMILLGCAVLNMELQ